MDSIFVQEIDDLLKQKLPKKSSISGAQLIKVSPDNTSDLAISTASTYRFRLPRMGGAYLARSKGQTGPFFSFSIYSYDNANPAVAEDYKGEIYSTFKSLRILVNGVEVHNNMYFNHTYADWMKMKPVDWLRSDAGNFGVTAAYGGAPFGALATQTGSGTVFTLPLPDNYSMLNSKDHAIPLEYLDIIIEVGLNNANNFLGKSADGANLTNPKISGLSLWIPVVYVDHEIDQAIKAKLEMADEDESEMMLLPVQDIRVDAQSYSFATAGTKTFIWNSVSSSCRLLEAKLSLDATDTTAYKTTTGLTGNITSYQYKIDGKNANQNPVTTGVTATDVNLAYPLYEDFVSAYNQINNDVPQMSPITKAQFLGSAATNPAHGAVLASGFAMVCNLDTVSKELVGGVKLLNNLSLEVTNNAGGAQSNVYLIQHSNRVIALSKSKCKVIR